MIELGTTTSLFELSLTNRSRVPSVRSVSRGVDDLRQVALQRFPLFLRRSCAQMQLAVLKREHRVVNRPRKVGKLPRAARYDRMGHLHIEPPRLIGRYAPEGPPRKGVSTVRPARHCALVLPGAIDAFFGQGGRKPSHGARLFSTVGKRGYSTHTVFVKARPPWALLRGLSNPSHLPVDDDRSAGQRSTLTEPNAPLQSRFLALG